MFRAKFQAVQAVQLPLLGCPSLLPRPQRESTESANNL